MSDVDVNDLSSGMHVRGIESPDARARTGIEDPQGVGPMGSTYG
jgi:hypothetical protein